MPAPKRDASQRSNDRALGTKRTAALRRIAQQSALKSAIKEEDACDRSSESSKIPESGRHDKRVDIMRIDIFKRRLIYHRRRRCLLSRPLQKLKEEATIKSTTPGHKFHAPSAHECVARARCVISEQSLQDSRRARVEPSETAESVLKKEPG